MTLSIPIWLAVPALTAALTSLALSAVLLVLGSAGRLHRCLAAALGAGALVQVGNGLGLLDGAHAGLWRLAALWGELLLPAALFATGLALMETPAPGEEATARWRVRAMTALAGLLGVLAWAVADDPSAAGSLERVCAVYLVLTLALALAQFEHILRAARDPARYQVKFLVIGLGALAGYEIYQASQLLLMPVREVEYVLAGSLAQLVALALIAYGLGRSRLQRVTARVYVSQRVLYGSVTFLVIGLYLIAVGMVAEILRYTGSSLTVVLSTVVVFVAAVGLVVALSSRAARASVRRFVARHFYRSRYDYRAKWLEVTGAFQGCGTVEAILDRLIDLLGRTFGAPRISVWLRYEADGRFHRVRSVNTEPEPAPLDGAHPLLARLAATDEPLVLDDPDRADLSAVDPFLQATRAALCVPIRSPDGLIAFATLSREGTGERYGTDECDLLRAIAHHVAVLLAHAGLAEERGAAAELEALHRFSAFCLHDVKNLAARLSLLVKNAEVHGQDPAFQRTAMRTVAATVQSMMGLITRLSLSSVPEGAPEPVDVDAAIAEAVAATAGGLGVPVRTEGEPVPPVLIRRDQFQQVLLNLLLNARDAVKERGEIRIVTGRRGGRAAIAVEDTGGGIPAAALRTLFQPRRSGKPGGLGIGLYQCKRIVEMQGGTIRVDTEAGRGTRVEIELPVAAQELASVAGASESRARSGEHGCW